MATDVPNALDGKIDTSDELVLSPERLAFDEALSKLPSHEPEKEQVLDLNDVRKCLEALKLLCVNPRREDGEIIATAFSDNRLIFGNEEEFAKAYIWILNNTVEVLDPNSNYPYAYSHLLNLYNFDLALQLCFDEFKAFLENSSLSLRNRYLVAGYLLPNLCETLGQKRSPNSILTESEYENWLLLKSVCENILQEYRSSEKNRPQFAVEIFRGMCKLREAILDMIAHEFEPGEDQNNFLALFDKVRSEADLKTQEEIDEVIGCAEKANNVDKMIRNAWIRGHNLLKNKLETQKREGADLTEDEEAYLKLFTNGDLVESDLEKEGFQERLSQLHAEITAFEGMLFELNELKNKLEAQKREDADLTEDEEAYLKLFTNGPLTKADLSKKDLRMALCQAKAGISLHNVQVFDCDTRKYRPMIER